MVDKEVSLLEKVLINWATPIDVTINWPLIKLRFRHNRPKYAKYIEEYGVVKGYYMSKIDDYKRLKDRASDNVLPKHVLKLYNGTPCGVVMKLMYRVFK